VTHTVSCFVFGHNYIQIAERAGHHEYVCSRCGHPLLFAIEHDPYARQGAFRKKVRYRCNLFGHHVHHVTERHGFTEYACHCGHSFLKEDAGKEVVKHPLVCLFSGHYVSFTESRGGYDEYRCRNCGHTFYFVVSR
jgi:DNA-directed RNA polymerase subunit RPC12/RpoP